MSTNSPPPGDALNSPDFSGRTGGDDVNENSGGGINGGKCKNNSFMLFGVRITQGSNPNPIRKSVSLSNLSQYKKLHESNHDVVAAGYASDDVVHKSTGIRDRKRGTPWTEEEHRLFLLGLQKVGKGDWRGISRNFVKTRTPTQVASHAQKYFIRRTNLNRRRRRSSLFDMTIEEENLQKLQADQQSNSSSGMILPVNGISIEPLSNQTKTHMKVINSIPLFPIPPSTRMNDLNLNSKSTESSESSSFNLVTSLDHDHKPKQQQLATPSSSSTIINSGFQVKNSLTNVGGGDIDLNNVIRVS